MFYFIRNKEIKNDVKSSFFVAQWLSMAHRGHGFIPGIAHTKKLMNSVIQCTCV